MTCWKWVTSTGHCYGEIVKTIRNIDLLWTGTAVGGKRHIPQLHSRSKVYLGFAQRRSPKRLRFYFYYLCSFYIFVSGRLQHCSTYCPVVPNSCLSSGGLGFETLAPLTLRSYTTASKLNIKCMKIKNYREEICLLQWFKRGTEDSLHNII